MTALTLALTCAALAMLVSGAYAKPPYLVQASWFRDRWSSESWAGALEQFSSIGGSEVWQRGVPFQRIYSVTDLFLDPQFAWCYTNGNNITGSSCFQAAAARIEAAGATLGAWISYSYQERYTPDIVLPCLESGMQDMYIESSRNFYIALISRNASSASVCGFGSGEIVDVVLSAFAGIDSKELLMPEASKRGMSVILGMPGIPGELAAPWNPDPELMPTFLIWLARVFADWDARFSSYPAFAGAYEVNEASLSVGSPATLVAAYGQINAVWRRQFGTSKRFVLSPYVDTNIAQVGKGATVAVHVENFMLLASQSGADLIAVQEGRGCAKAAYFWPQQVNEAIGSVDPLLLDVVLYLDPAAPANQTFAAQYVASTRQLFQGFSEALDMYAASTPGALVPTLWANLEAFEYTRSNPCLPVDPVGNGMQEILDRTEKYRIDWGANMQGAFVSGFASFAWDSDYICTPPGYDRALFEEIADDAWRPIVSNAWVNTSAEALQVLGFFITEATHVVLQYNATGRYGGLPTQLNVHWGAENGLSPQLVLASLALPAYVRAALVPGSLVSVTARTGERESFHPVYVQLPS